jgi:hypothetical protein
MLGFIFDHEDGSVCSSKMLINFYQCQSALRHIGELNVIRSHHNENVYCCLN